MRMRCPHCKATAHSRTSAQVTDLTRKGIFVCSNYECGHTFSVISTVEHTISPSATPDSSVALPLSSHTRRSLLQHQLEHMPKADYTPTHVSQPRTLDLFEADPHPG